MNAEINNTSHNDFRASNMEIPDKTHEGEAYNALRNGYLAYIRKTEERMKAGIEAQASDGSPENK